MGLKKGKNTSLHKKRAGLGRGFAGIFAENEADKGHVEIVPAGKLKPGRFQPRQKPQEADIEELATSIRQYGVLQPLLVRPIEEEPGFYEIIAGERRWRAAQRGQCYDIPVYVRALDEKEAYIAALAENLQREDLNPIEEAEAFEKLIAKYTLSQEDVAAMIGKSRSYITNILRLLKLPKAVREMLRDGRLSSGHGRVLLSAEEPQKLAQLVIDKGLTVRQTEELVRQEKGKKKPTSSSRKKVTLSSQNVVGFLEKRCGVQASLSSQGKGGILNIRFEDNKQLAKLLKLFKN